MKITTDTRTCTSPEAVYRQVILRYGHEEIDDACALVIASWYASPGLYGSVFAELATTGCVDHEMLLDAVHYDARRHATESRDQRALDMLCTWAIAKSNALQPV